MDNGEFWGMAYLSITNFASMLVGIVCSVHPQEKEHMKVLQSVYRGLL